MVLREGNNRFRREVRHIAALSTINGSQKDLGSNPILRGDSSTTYGPSHGTVIWYSIIVTAGGRVPCYWNIMQVCPLNYVRTLHWLALS
jgi:hypothetical protein